MAISISGSVGLNGANRAPDVMTIQKALNDISPSAGGASPQLVVDGKSGPKTQAAILHFQQVHPGLSKDSKVDPGGSTLGQINLALDPSSSADPKALALQDMIISQSWAQFALVAANGLIVGNTAAAMETHFHLSKGLKPQSFYLQAIRQNYTRVIAAFGKAGQLFRSRSDAQAVSDRGVDKNGVPFPAYTFFAQSINFTSTFKQFNGTSGFGPLCRAAMVLHEPVHFVDQLANIPNDIFEHSPQYPNITPEVAIHNPSSYVCFAQQIFFGSDTRFGAGKPSQ